MSRRFIAAVLASSLMVAGLSALPARAAEDDLARVLGTAATLFVLGSALNQNDDARIRVHDTRPGRKYDGVNRHRLDHLPQVVGPADGVRQRARQKAVLPRDCMLQVSGGGTRNVMSRACLQARGWNLDAMPRRCVMDVRLGDKRRKALSVSCLRNAGYEVAGANARDRHMPKRWQPRN